MIRRIITAVIAFILGATCAVGGFFVYRKVKPTDKTNGVSSVQSAALLASDTSKNPYENPDDPNTSADGTCFSTGTVTGYFLELYLKGEVGTVYNMDRERFARAFQKKFKSNTGSATALITFEDILYNDRPVFVSGGVSFSTNRSWFAGNPKVTFSSDLLYNEDLNKNNAIRLPKQYYDFLKVEKEKERNLGRCRIILIWNGDQTACFNGKVFTLSYRLIEKELSADVDDPTSPNFVLPGWSGLMQIVNGKGCDADSIPQWLWIVGIILAVILLIGLLRWALGKK